MLKDVGLCIHLLLNRLPKSYFFIICFCGAMFWAGLLKVTIVSLWYRKLLLLQPSWGPKCPIFQENPGTDLALVMGVVRWWKLYVC